MTEPRFALDWEGLATMSEQLLADRIATDPGSVAAGKLTEAQADDRKRIMGSVVAIWWAVVRGAPMPELQASHGEMRRDLADVRAKLSTVAAARPDNTTVARRLEAIVALEWNHRPCMPGHDLPWILHVHAANLIGRARAMEARASRPPSTGGDHVNRSAERATLATGGGRSVAAPTPKQTALL